MGYFTPKSQGDEETLSWRQSPPARVDALLRSDYCAQRHWCQRSDSKPVSQRLAMMFIPYQAVLSGRTAA
jgi:hypothetical protein